MCNKICPDCKSKLQKFKSFYWCIKCGKKINSLKKTQKSKTKSLRLSMIVIVLFTLFLLHLCLISAEQQTLGTFKLNNCVELLQTCSNCTYTNISSVIYPNSSQALGQVAMTKIGTKYNYTFCNTASSGDYIVNGFSDVNGITTVWAYSFTVTFSGTSTNTSNALFYIGIMVLLLVFSGFFIYCFIRFDNMLLRVIMIGLVYLMLVGLSAIAYQVSFDFTGSNSFITAMLNIIWMILMYLSIVIFPALFIWYLYMISKIKEINQLINKGISEEEAEHRVKNRRNNHGK